MSGHNLFARQVAEFAYASGARGWLDIAEAYPEMVEELNRLRIALLENISIAEVHVMKI